MDSARHTCIKLEISNPVEPKTIFESIFIKSTWFDSHFDLVITNGLHSWVCNASEEEVRERASQWDQPVSEYVQLAERFLGFQQPGHVYGFSDAGNGCRRLTWTFEKEGTKLEWRWKCQPSSNTKNITAEILEFLMDANRRLSEEMVKKTELMERMKVESENCLAQSERINNERMEFESVIYTKFLGVLNSKKKKLRELRDQLSKQESTGKSPEEEEEEGESTEKTESFDDESDDGKSKEVIALHSPLISKAAAPSSSRGGKRTKRK